MMQQSPVRDVFVGRDDVLKQLKVNFNNLMEGRGRVIFVAGEAGIGKTAVVKHFLNELLPLTESGEDQSRPQIFVLQANCDPIVSGNPYGPFASLLQGLPDVGREKIVEKLKDWAREIGPALVEGIVPYVGPALSKVLEKYFGIEGRGFGVIPTDQMYQFLRLFEQLSEACPLILFIDDLHWADESSLKLMFKLAQGITEKQILLIGTYRPHEIVERSGYPHPLSKMLFELQRHDLRYEIPLEQFVPDEIDSFLNRCYPNNKFPLSFRTMLYKETNGLPFFLDQEVRWLADEGHLFLDIDNRWSVKPLDTVPIPEGALGVVQDRVNKLDPDSRRLLTYASLFGEQFRSQVLAKILEKSHLSLLETLRGLATGYNMIRPIVDVAQSKLRPNWAFKHAFVQEVLYDLLLTEEKSELHRLAVDALESLFHDTLNELAGELAHHCEAAKRYDDAIKYRIAAAHRAYIAQSLTEHAAHLAQGIYDVEQLERSEAGLRDEVVLLSGWANVRRQLMALDDEEEAANRLLQLFDQGDGNPVAGIEGYIGLTHVAAQRGDKSRAIRCIEKAWNIARASNEAHHMVRVAHFIAYGRYSFIPKSMRKYMDEAIEFCRKGNSPALLSKSLLCRGAIAFLDGEDDMALPLFRQAIRVCKGIQESDIRCVEDYPFAITYYSPRRFIPDCYEYIGRIHRRRGEWQQAIEGFKRVYKYKHAEKNLAGMSGLLNVIAETQLMAGAKEDADRSFEQSWPIAQQHDSLELKAMVLSTGITIALEQDDVKAKRRLTLFEDVTHNLDTKWTWHKKQMTHGILSMRAKATNKAASFLTVGLKAAEEEDDFGLITQYSLHLAELSLQSSDLDQALHYANNALQIARRHDLWDKGEVYMTAAHVKVSMNKINEAEELIEQAVEYFQDKKLSQKAILAQEFRLQIRNA